MNIWLIRRAQIKMFASCIDPLFTTSSFMLIRMICRRFLCPQRPHSEFLWFAASQTHLSVTREMPLLYIKHSVCLEKLIFILFPVIHFQPSMSLSRSLDPLIRAFCVQAAHMQKYKQITRVSFPTIFYFTWITLVFMSGESYRASMASPCFYLIKHRWSQSQNLIKINHNMC